ncbi:vanadium-dependent haloperoxidase [Lunatibacter salilacus]|uniref:vanadium-dependent haloperoxidase n=1 Tax=Lunatibacter salilacus TaxID=2483804 RepID=UPI00131A93A4|nr:vanadium-dependent haloperoxidase [Lunatibacter salilacus]
MHRATFIRLAFLVCLSLSWSLTSFGQRSLPQEDEVSLFLDNLFSATDVMVTDVAAPTGAARFYSYMLLGAYIVQSDLFPDHVSPTLYEGFTSPFELEKENLPIRDDLDAGFCSIYTLLEIGKAIMPSGKKLEKSQELLLKTYQKKRIIPKKDIARHISYAEHIAAQVISYAAEDGYRKLSALKRYSPKNQPGTWYPTPPAYMAAIDPEWKTIRTFLLPSLEPFKPSPPKPYNLTEGSAFQLLVQEVYQVTSALSEEQILIANFWDCNPFKVEYTGHMAIGLKKISPGGHWIGITGIASQKAGLNLTETIRVHTFVALGLHDAFVSCWEEKYNSDRIRPITAINESIDPSWQPLLQTPPFPEYTSGHSVISRVSARILTAYFGDSFDFVDDSEVFFGLPERSFQSFIQAADEAAISRLYGGIHFKDAIEEGVSQGDKIADYMLQKHLPARLQLGQLHD